MRRTRGVRRTRGGSALRGTGPLAALGLAAAVLAAGAAPALADGSLITVIDNREADSILEVDRTGNVQSGSSGSTAGSDHDGSAVDAIQALFGEAEPDDD
ncbi:hypothetical protein SLA_4360 [Streptomyces laurentii]|uniref:Uncharacterized protein n=1 Tax=Streptomyces laurentii TaxID=39478 RepID=A0A169NSI3_STRLU|nr:hypothetical protein SLA_4360 [Streptomyces laurentii]